MPQSVNKFLEAATAGKLSRRDRQFLNSLSEQVKLSPGEEAADMLSNISPSNLRDLQDAIDTAPTPEQRAVLVQHQNRVADYIKAASTGIVAKSAPADGPPYNADNSSMLCQISSLLSNLWSK